MARGTRLRMLAAILGAGAIVVVGSAWLSAGEAERATRGLLRASRLASRLLAFSPIDADVLEGLFFNAGSLRVRVGVQIGHLQVGDVPPEQRHLVERGGGAVSGPYHEVDINLAIAVALSRILMQGGIRVDLLYATVPPRYLADAVLAIHADGAATQARGWKMASPWRASAASTLLLDSLMSAYGERTGLPWDPYGVTAGMKGYYAFSPQRYVYAVSPLTPAVIVETGFVTVEADRAVIVRQPERVAGALAAGLVRYLAHRPLPHSLWGRASYLPRTYPPALLVVPDLLRAAPGDDQPVLDHLPAGTVVVPVQPRGDWTEVQVRGSWRRFGWVHTESMKPRT